MHILRLMRALRFLVASCAFVPALALAADFGVITIEQNSAGELGTWELLYNGGTLKYNDINVSKRSQTVRPKPGVVTLSVEPPPGATTKIQVFKNGTFVSTQQTRQRTVDLLADEEYRFVVQYIFNKNGMLGVTSNEAGISFRMVGPDGKTYRGVTPKSYPSMPAGQYSIYPQKAGCIRPRPMNRTVKDGERTVIFIELDCTTTTTARSRGEETRPVPSRRNLQNSVDARETARTSRHRR